ncbi:hypothetical protein D3C78_1135510 [compost metagenome]
MPMPSREQLKDALQTLLAAEGSVEIPTFDSILAKLVSDQADLVCEAIRKKLLEDLPGLHRVHYIKNYAIEINYKDDLHEATKREVRSRLNEAGWYDITFHPYTSGQSKIVLLLKSQEEWGAEPVETTV